MLTGPPGVDLGNSDTCDKIRSRFGLAAFDVCGRFRDFYDLNDSAMGCFGR